MLMDQITPDIGQAPPDAMRSCIHDLRNLFAVVGMAKPLLERDLDEPQKRIVMDGLARVAVEGKLVTDRLLGGGAVDGACSCDAQAELAGVSTIAAALSRPGLSVEMAVENEASCVLMPSAEFRAVVLELITNAVAAGASCVRVRAARRGCRYWLVVGDDGAGFPADTLTLAHLLPAGLHGTGMRRLAAAASAARGKVRIKSRSGRGTVITLVLPIMGVVPKQLVKELSR